MRSEGVAGLSKQERSLNRSHAESRTDLCALEALIPYDADCTRSEANVPTSFTNSQVSANTAQRRHPYLHACHRHQRRQIGLDERRAFEPSSIGTAPGKGKEAGSIALQRSALLIDLSMVSERIATHTHSHLPLQPFLISGETMHT